MIHKNQTNQQNHSPDKIATGTNPRKNKHGFLDKF
jgi:hypothetical protein